jgi:hypothetical protein
MPPGPSSAFAENVRRVLRDPVLSTDVQADTQGLGALSEPKFARTLHRLPPVREGIVVNIHEGGQTGNLASLFLFYFVPVSPCSNIVLLRFVVSLGLFVLAAFGGCGGKGVRTGT